MNQQPRNNVNRANILRWRQALGSREFAERMVNRDEMDWMRVNIDGQAVFSPLGVACELALENGVPLVRTEEREGRVTYDGHAIELPLAAQNWLGVGRRANPIVMYFLPFEAAINEIDRLLLGEE